MVQVLHAVRGRARFAIAPLYHSPALQRWIEQRLSQPEAVESVRANPRTGTVLVLFAPEQSWEAIAQQLHDILEQFDHQHSHQHSHQQFPKQPPKQQSQKQPESSQGEDSKLRERRRRSRRRQATTSQAVEQPQKDWHKLDPATVLQTFGSEAIAGLAEDEVASQRSQYGANVLEESQTRSDLSILLEQFQGLPVALLGGAAVLSAATGGLIDALVILSVVGINAAVGYVTESQSEHIIQSLQQSGVQTATVVRQGSQQTVSTEDLVPGDVLVLDGGSNVAADARLIAAEHLQINESSLTGESIPVAKQVEALTGDEIPLAERQNMVYKGTLVTEGSGRAVVVATGRYTEIGKIQQMVSQASTAGTPLQQQLDDVGTRLALIGGGVCGLVFGIGWLRGYGFLEMLKISISLAVAAVPEGLPAIATTTLALGMQEMRDRHILIRGLEAVEALGSVQTICLDKTGTLTQNQMVVQAICTGQERLQVKSGSFVRESGEAVGLQALEEVRRLVEVGVLCSESEFQPDANNDFFLRGSATENALIYLAVDAGVDVPALRDRFPRTATYRRSEDRNVMSTVHDCEEGDRLMAVKGSPEEVLERCQSWMIEGEIFPLSESERRDIALANERMAGQALRVLGVAYKPTPAEPQEAVERHLIWLGLVGMADPIRGGVNEFIQGFHQAGIDTVMITGDQSPTAYAIAKQLQLSRRRQTEILDSSDLSGLDSEKQQALFDKVDVFARVSPASKLQIVQALQAVGRVVAMTGDGINDMPALKAADVGVAMGAGSQQVVQDVADMIIEDDQLQTLIDAVGQGRTTYNNIRKSVHFLLSTNMGEIIVTTITTALGLGEPLNTMELLWLNLVSDIFPGLALALEPPEPDILDQPPRDPDEPILRDRDFSRIALESGTISLCALTAYSYSLLRYGRGREASTTLFMSLTIGQILHTWSCRSETHSIFDRPALPRNPYAEGAIALSLGLQLLPIVVPPLRNLLQLAVLDPVDWSVILTTALLSLIINESTKTGEFPVKRRQR